MIDSCVDQHIIQMILLNQKWHQMKNKNTLILDIFDPVMETCRGQPFMHLKINLPQSFRVLKDVYMPWYLVASLST